MTESEHHEGKGRFILDRREIVGLFRNRSKKRNAMALRKSGSIVI